MIQKYDSPAEADQLMLSSRQGFTSTYPTDSGLSASTKYEATVSLVTHALVLTDRKYATAWHRAFVPGSQSQLLSRVNQACCC